MKAFKLSIVFFCVSLLLSSCIKKKIDDLLDPDIEDPVAEYEIYYRWTENLSFPSGSNASGCTTIGSNYNNSHPGLSSGISKNQFYGPLTPGSFVIDLRSTGGGTYNGTLEAPAKGYRRYYTHLIKEYTTNVNRCLVVYKISYVDEKM
ncbi:hypothetical protein ACFS6H_08210 [Terrimonas rubra]|jgi:hypothetical protein|uniref:Lipoprotein n=1 Tax=Terrimonas rubra TaxID=1035890 RepID=A0ABW6A5G7_9BACT